MAGAPPSGRQYVIRHASQEAIITEVGATLRRYRVNGHEILDGFGEDELCTVARGQPLIPWPNRLRDGRYEFKGASYQTALTEPSKQNAIHGLVRWMNWSGSQPDEATVLMRLLLHPQEGYPFQLSLAIEYRLSDRGLAVTTTASNAGDTALPYGAGHHPYLTLGGPTIDEASLKVPVLLRMEADERQIPTGRLVQVKDTRFDFLELRPIGDTRMDDAFTSLVPDADNVSRIVMQAPSGRPRMTFWMDRAYPYLMVFTGDTIPQAARRRKGLGIEPMTCAPNAFQSGLGLITLEPGASTNSSWGIFAVV